MKQILLLGAGMVTRPLTRYLLDHPGFKLTIVDQMADKAEKLIDRHPDGTALALLADNTEKLGKLIQEHDITISLLPAPLHPVVAKLCIERKKHMVTTSYISPAMKDLDAPAKDAGVMILNEIGVDPGMDHMSAMRIIHDVQKRGGTVASFRSYCGGLPAPENNDNPWGYKFSWSPRAVCTAGKNPARYRLDGKTVDVPGPELFTDSGHGMEIEGIGYLESYPNRDSLGYIETYGLEGIETMFRGTLRYPGWCDTLKKIVDLGMLEETPTTYPDGTTYAQYMGRFLDNAPTDNIRKDIAGKCSLDESSAILDRFEWLGLFGDDEIAITGKQTTPLDILAARMDKKMAYGPGEKDMIVLRHDFVARFPDGPDEHITSTLIDFGQVDEDSSMARTVSLPAAVATKLILTGKVMLPGVHVPVVPEIYNPVLDELTTMGIDCKEKTEKLG